MIAKSRADLLLSPWFIMGLATLLLNDLVLKYEYLNELTGKLSDFAGLFIFPFFLSAFLPKYNKVSYALSIVIFSFWNSILSEGLIEFFDSNGILPLNSILLTLFFIYIGIYPISNLTC